MLHVDVWGLIPTASTPLELFPLLLIHNCNGYVITIKYRTAWAVVVALLAGRSLPAPEIRGLNPIIDSIIFLKYLHGKYITIIKTKIKKERLGKARLKKDRIAKNITVHPMSWMPTVRNFYPWIRAQHSQCEWEKFLLDFRNSTVMLVSVVAECESQKQGLTGTWSNFQILEFLSDWILILLKCMSSECLTTQIC